MFGWFKRRGDRAAAREAIDLALSDDILTRQEFLDIKAMGDTASEVLTERLREIATHEIGLITRRVIETRRFLPEDEQDILNLCARLRIDPVDYSALMPFRLIWELENDEKASLPVVARPPVRLARGEVCHFIAEYAEWREWGMVTEHRGYVTPSVRVRIAKGVSVGLSRSRPVVNKREELRLVSPGSLAITSGRVIFAGTRKSRTFKLQDIAAVEPYRDATEIRPTRGEPAIFLMSEAGAELAFAILNRLP